VLRDEQVNDLAAVYYAATLAPDPTLWPDSDTADHAVYLAMGESLSSALNTPRRIATLRCSDSRRATFSDLSDRAIATVHDRRILVIRERRGTNAMGFRLLSNDLIDIPMAQREGHKLIRFRCHLCDSIHEERLTALKRARINEPSHPSGPLPLDPFDRDTPRYMAFAETTGAFSYRGTLFVRATPWRLALYLAHFGPAAEHHAHYRRLIGTNTLPWAMSATGHDHDLEWPDQRTIATEARRVTDTHR